MFSEKEKLSEKIYKIIFLPASSPPSPPSPPTSYLIPYGEVQTSGNCKVSNISGDEFQCMSQSIKGLIIMGDREM